MSGNKGAPSHSLVQTLPNGVARQQTLPRDDTDEDEVTFEVKMEGLSGLTSEWVWQREIPDMRFSLCNMFQGK